jgi:flagellar basal body rod protein FlgC
MKDNRRQFIKKTALGTTGITLGASTLAFSAKSYNSIKGANDRINVSVIGVRGQGFGHLRRWAGMAKSDNVYVKTVCDVDENLFAERVSKVQEIQGEKPGTEVDMRKVFEDPDIDVVSFATPNHWHALGTIWAVQAGKDVYVEKPCSHNVWEGRQMIEAARKYNRIVQVGFQNRSIPNVRKAMQALNNGVIGDVYMAKGLCYKPRGSFGRSENSAPPAGLHYDLWLGPGQSGGHTMRREAITTGTGTGTQVTEIPETRVLTSLILPAGDLEKMSIL